MKNFRQLLVWQKSYDFSLKIYKVTASFPTHQKYSLVSQLQRASTSICANIAEGCSRGSDSELCRFLYISSGSASEVDCFIEIAKGLNYISKDDYILLNKDITEILKILSKFINKLKSDIKKNR